MKVHCTTSSLDGSLTVYAKGKRQYWLPSEIVATVEGLPWRLEFVVRPDKDGVPAITSVAVAQRENGPAVSTSMIREVALNDALAEAIEQGAWVFELRAGTTDVWEMKHQPPPGGFGMQVARRGKRVEADDVRRAVALFTRYRQEPGNTYQQIADEMQISRATAARYVRRAKEHGFLSMEGDK